MCIICCSLLCTWRRSWIDCSAATGFGNLVNAQSSWLLPSANAVRMNFGAWQDLARSIRAPEQFFERYGNGGKKRRKWQIDRHFTFYETASSWKRRKISLRDLCLVTDIFRPAGSRLFAKRQNL